MSFFRIANHFWHRIQALRDLVRDTLPLLSEKEFPRALWLFKKTTRYLQSPITNPFKDPDLENLLFGPAPLRAHLLGSSCLVMLISSFEILVAGLISEYLRTHPKVLLSD